MNKLFTIEFDTTIAYWDFKHKRNKPRPGTLGLINLLLDYGRVSHYSNTSKYLAESFVHCLRTEYGSSAKFDELKMNIGPEFMTGLYDVLDISAFYNHKRLNTDKITHIHTIPSFLGQMIDDDDELVKLSIYFERKLDINEAFSNHNFDDWEDRINLLYNHFTSNI